MPLTATHCGLKSYSSLLHMHHVISPTASSLSIADYMRNMNNKATASACTPQDLDANESRDGDDIVEAEIILLTFI